MTSPLITLLLRRYGYAVHSCASGAEALGSRRPSRSTSCTAVELGTHSFVDARSFAVMRRNRIREALAFDGDFTAAGFLEARP